MEARSTRSTSPVSGSIGTRMPRIWSLKMVPGAGVEMASLRSGLSRRSKNRYLVGKMSGVPSRAASPVNGLFFDPVGDQVVDYVLLAA